MPSESINSLKPNDIAIVSMPFDAYSSFLKGAAKAPQRFNQIWQSGSAGASSESCILVKQNPHIIDTGYVNWEHDEEAFSALGSRINDILAADARPLTIGGDHSITYPIIKSLAAKYSHFTILHFDAHPDLYDEFKGNKLSHACPFARIMENKLASRLVQVGIRTLNEHQSQQIERFDVEVHEMKHYKDHKQIVIDQPVYISIDIDALDPAFAPGVSHLEPGGLSTRDIISIIQNLSVPIVGADIVEFNPDRDINDMTAMVVIKLYKELCGKMLSPQLV